AQVNLRNYKDICQFLRVQGYLLNRRVYKGLCKKVRELNHLGYQKGDIRKFISLLFFDPQ
ncbi:MAG: hypothetical protein ACI914_000576, partial [Candidatus Marivariicella framensis]